MHPPSDHDRSAVELTMRLLFAASREAMAAGDVALANVRHIAAVECGALLDECTKTSPSSTVATNDRRGFQP